MVPITPSLLQIDLLARWQARVVLVARTALGTINHSLLSLEALRARHVPVFGVAFVGEENAPVRRTIADLGRATDLGRLPPVTPLDAASLKKAFASAFAIEKFLHS
jgi:dethiobiotin synthetase